MGGGLAIAEGARVLARLPLPVAGLMSDQPVAAVAAAYDELLSAAAELGSPLHDPFMAMSFMALEVIPKLKLTDKGLVDVESFGFVDLFVDNDGNLGIARRDVNVERPHGHELFSSSSDLQRSIDKIRANSS